MKIRTQESEAEKNIKIDWVVTEKQAFTFGNVIVVWATLYNKSTIDRAMEFNYYTHCD